MSDPAVALSMLGILVFAILIGFPVAFTLMALGVGFGYYAYFQAGQAFIDNRVFYLLTQNTFTVANNDALVSIPLFLLMGYLIERAGILDNLFKSLQIATRKVPGSLAVATLATCALFATATGIVGAVVTLMGLLAFPQRPLPLLNLFQHVIEGARQGAHLVLAVLLCTHAVIPALGNGARRGRKSKNGTGNTAL